jgi:signal transduction histidine kinase
MSKIALNFKSIFVGAVKIGVSDGIDLDTEKMIILTNTLAFLYALFIFTFFTAFALSGLTILAEISLLWFAANFIWVEVNRRHRYFLASFGLVLFTDIFGFIVCWLVGKEAKFHYGYFAATGVPLILFAASKKLVAFFVILAMVLFFTLEWLPDSLASVQSLSAYTVGIVHTVINLTVFLCTFATVYYYYQINLKTEEKLRTSILLAENANQQVIEAHNSMVQREKIVALGEMAGSMAHEINSPLMAIIMNAESLVRLARV